ncbi:MAG TPA: SDR family oxidoreductase, partial [Streptosporangiaceae bacterium]|nr:SDR family oxidoreductase [Streptosporangiaceae bacterium]
DPRGDAGSPVPAGRAALPHMYEQGFGRIHGISEDRVVEEIMLTEPAIKRLIEPAEVAGLVAYLCSPPASFANGSSYLLDGGWSAR